MISPFHDKITKIVWSTEISPLSVAEVSTSTAFHTICQSFDENSLWVIDGISTNSKSINNWIVNIRSHMTVSQLKLSDDIVRFVWCLFSLYHHWLSISWMPQGNCLISGNLSSHFPSLQVCWTDNVFLDIKVNRNIWAPAMTSSGSDSWDREDLRFGFLRFSTIK